MDYQKIYDKIIKNAKSQKRLKGDDKHYEGHHIIPKCMGGQGSSSNIDTQEIIDSTVSAANHFNVSRKTIRNWINKNYLIRWDS